MALPELRQSAPGDDHPQRGWSAYAASFDLAAIWAGRARDPVIEGDDKVVVDTSGIKSLWRGIIETLPSFIVFTYL